MSSSNDSRKKTSNDASLTDKSTSDKQNSLLGGLIDRELSRVLVVRSSISAVESAVAKNMEEIHRVLPSCVWHF